MILFRTRMENSAHLVCIWDPLNSIWYWHVLKYKMNRNTNKTFHINWTMIREIIHFQMKFDAVAYHGSLFKNWCLRMPIAMENFTFSFFHSFSLIKIRKNKFLFYNENNFWKLCHKYIYITRWLQTASCNLSLLFSFLQTL